MTGLLVAALLAVQPLPAPGDAVAGQAATECIFYYRLESTFVPGGDAACEAKGYGLEFMRAHWKEIAALEAKHQQELDAKLAEAHRRAEAMSRRSELEGPCFAIYLDGGPGPDGGAALCELAGLSHDVVTRIARHRALLAATAAGQTRARHVRWAAGALAGLLVLAAAIRALVRRGSG